MSEYSRLYYEVLCVGGAVEDNEGWLGEYEMAQWNKPLHLNCVSSDNLDVCDVFNLRTTQNCYTTSPTQRGKYLPRMKEMMYRML